MPVMKQLHAISDVIATADASLREGASAAPRAWPTGFPSLDDVLGGGVRAGELILLGGPPGLGKTALALQVLRNIVADGGSTLYFSYEHDEPTVLQRLLGIEIGENAGVDAPTVADIRTAF